MTPKSERPESQTKRARRVFQLLFLALATAFIVSSTWQVEQQVFGRGPLAPDYDPNCTFAVKAFDESVDRGLSHAALAASRAKAEEAFEDEVTTPLETVRKHCKQGEEAEAFVAATRLRDAAESAIDEQQSNLANVRRGLRSRLPPRSLP